jgi:hypothetical protein
MPREIKSDIPNTKFPWKKMKQDENSPIKYDSYVLYVGLVDSLITEAGARLYGNPELAGTWQELPVLWVSLMDCGDGMCYIRGDLGEIGGDEAVTLAKGEQYLETKIEAIVAFAKAMGIEVKEREDDT